MSHAAENKPQGSRLNPRMLGAAVILYALLIAYGSLYPFSEWTSQVSNPFSLKLPPGRARLFSADILTNVLAYVPFGLLLALWFGERIGRLAAVFVALSAGTLLSLSMELVQQHLPNRVPSVVDLMTNATGTLIGALVAQFVHSHSAPGRALRRWRSASVTAGGLADLGLVALGLWALSQLSPLVPSIDLGNLRQGLAPVWRVLQQPANFSLSQFAVYTLAIAGLAMLARTLEPSGRRLYWTFVGFVALVLLLKIPVVTRQISAEAVVGAAVAVTLVGPWFALPRRLAAWIGFGVILGATFVSELRANADGPTYAFNWIPFRGQLENTLVGIASILEVVWPAAAMAYLARFASSIVQARAVQWTGALGLALTMFGLEWNQQSLPGRVGDFTAVLLAVGAWMMVWWIPVAAPVSQATAAPQAPRSGRRRRPGALVLLSLFAMVAVIGVGAVWPSLRQTEVRADESTMPKLPVGSELPPVSLPGFRLAHPRLPYPSASDLALLTADNQPFVRQLRSQAKGGGGEIEAAVLMEVIEPGSIDLELLHSRLMALKFEWRGHAQGKPMAVAYDWLYDRWSAGQLEQLQGKLAEGCNYLVELIRNDRLSPYNVYLYNAPFQALMACAIALYQDDPRGEFVMRFANDLWKQRVLPVWRQVMGRHGGWHEGGEYVGIGIGQAIYQVPAMWRKATGEDVFAEEPGIRGFLDFLVYRTRPDGTHFRWGDGNHFDRIVPDASALAIEFNHAAAYSLRPPAKKPTPTAWPWGPLSDPSLLDPGAAARLPLVGHFDGIGLIVARSDWTPQATYVTFKAGDNYWSHNHLDQGAFTIYKGGELAIDSGFYGPSYGSDHHMNYGYQTVAHNTITVTDPDDVEPAPEKQGNKPRQIANDGGQRRIGSGWGVEPAPLDRAEWEAKRRIYHTGAIERLVDKDGITVAAADITPAYTNERSGKGTFSHRTRRVERILRTFGYDRIDDVVVVFDQVKATKASFRKRWLLHTIEAPRFSGPAFEVEIAAQDRPGRQGGRLNGTVLLPKNAQLNAIGGRGLEFFVDGTNFDEGGTLDRLIGKQGPGKGEPGGWRIEVSPATDAQDDVFLVVLLPSGADATPMHRVRLIEEGNRVGCEVVGPTRTTLWWFVPGSSEFEVSVLATGGAK